MNYTRKIHIIGWRIYAYTLVGVHEDSGAHPSRMPILSRCSSLLPRLCLLKSPPQGHSGPPTELLLDRVEEFLGNKRIVLALIELFAMGHLSCVERIVRRGLLFV